MNPSKILILGANGMLGHKLFFHFSALNNFDCYGSVRSTDDLAPYLSHLQIDKLYSGIDVNNTDSLIRIIAMLKPDVVINCIGIIKQVPASQNSIQSISINALLPHRIAMICQAADARMIHISTDCVFDGNMGNYREDDIPNAVDLYGRSKLLGEVSYPHCLTIRTSIIGHELKSKHGLVEWFLSQNTGIQGFTRHIYSGVPTIELGEIIAHHIIPRPYLNGVYHLSAEPISKYDLLKLIALKYQKSTEIKPYNEPYCDRSLDSTRLRAALGYKPPSWPELIDKMYQDYVNSPYQN